MSANFHAAYQARRQRQRRFLQRPPSTDLDSTADVHEEFTADLDPSTADIVRNDAQPEPTTASPAAQPASDAEQRPEQVAHDPVQQRARIARESAQPGDSLVREPAQPRNLIARDSQTRDTVAKVAKTAEPPIVARPTESPLDVTGPIIAREAAASEPATPAIDATMRMPLPFGRRESFVSPPAATSGAITEDVPVVQTPASVERKPSVQASDVTDDVYQPARPTLTAQPSAWKADQGQRSDLAGLNADQAPTNKLAALNAEQAEPRTPAAANASQAQPSKLAALKADQARRPALAPGKVLCDRYLLEQVIGCGGTGIVFRARDMLSGKGTAPNIQVAIKTPRPELGNPERAAKRLKHEFEHAKLLSHPSIVRVFDLQEDEGRCFMTMELVQGKLLSQLLRDWTMVPVSLAYKILRQSAEALQYAHSQNVVHGDFKPGNVFITPEEGVRIVDFGTAAGPTANDSRIPAGTPTYASPEVLSGETPDRRDDVFSFACVAYELLTGQHPFGRQSSLQAREEAKIPPRAWNLSTSQWLSLLSALSWKRDARPDSVEELLMRLNPEQPVVAAPVPVHVDPEEVVPAELPADLMPKQRSWGFFAFIACALLVTYFAYQRSSGPDDGATKSLLPAATSLPAPQPPVAAKQPEAEAVPAAPAAVETKDETSATTAEAPAAAAAPAVTASKPRAAAAPVSEISFESSSVVTSESSVAAVFLIKRSQPLSGRVSVSWKAVSGSADAGIDFASDASGTVTFADGQAQRAIYVPLRNDLLKEGDETFYVDLIGPKSAKIGKLGRAEAIIRDDD